MQRSDLKSAKSPRGLSLCAKLAWLRVPSPSLVALVSLLLSLGCLQATAETDNSIQSNVRSVGEVSLVLGRAYLEREDARVLIETGAKVRVGDRVFTEAGGHVHVRFVDDALVSVRPSSTLDVVRYDYDASKPENSAVKFELSEGVARAISGEAAKSARERFRMNTPIAAIGVRGTDFVVSANSRSTRALVNEGAIVMAPYSSECSSEALGPCAVDAVELSQNTLQVLELGSGNPAPRLVAASSERTLSEIESSGTTDASAADAQVAADDTADTLDSTEVYLESVATTKITTEVAAAEKGETPPPTDLPETPVILADFTPTEALTADSTATDQLVWGRWASTGAPSLLSLSLSEAREGAGGRDVTVASTSGFILYRSEPNGARVESGLGVVRLDLNAAEAFYDSSNGIVAMRVAGGNLELDFVDRAFATSLNLDGGYLRLKEDSKTLSGAVATDGSAAGYFFEQQLDTGRIQGITLWGAQ
jgi:hypothetical protein